MSSEFHHGESIVQSKDKYYELHHGEIHRTDESGNIIESAHPIVFYNQKCVHDYGDFAYALSLCYSVRTSHIRKEGIYLVV